MNFMEGILEIKIINTHNLWSNNSSSSYLSYLIIRPTWTDAKWQVQEWKSSLYLEKKSLSYVRSKARCQTWYIIYVTICIERGEYIYIYICISFYVHMETLKRYIRKKLSRCSSRVEEEKDGGSDLGGHKTMMGERLFTSIF